MTDICLGCWLPKFVFKDFEILRFSFLVPWMIKQFWSNGEVPRIHQPHMDRETWKLVQARQVFMSVKQVGLAAVKLRKLAAFDLSFAYKNCVYNIYIIYWGCFKAFVVHQLFKSTQNASGYRILSVPYTVQGLGEWIDGWWVRFGWQIQLYRDFFTTNGIQ